MIPISQPEKALLEYCPEISLGLPSTAAKLLGLLGHSNHRTVF